MFTAPVTALGADVTDDGAAVVAAAVIPPTAAVSGVVVPAAPTAVVAPVATEAWCLTSEEASLSFLSVDCVAQTGAGSVRC